MSDDMYTRTRLLLGDDGIERLRNASVIICGCGAVGGYTAEAMVRAGVGRIRFVDGDTFSESNLNRQILCTHGTIGRYKSEVAEERALSINPSLKADHMVCHISAETLPSIFDTQCDLLLDCIDTLACKAELIRYAYSRDIPVFSSMGAAMHMDPTRIHASTLDKTSVCPVARSLRKSLRDIDQSSIRVVYSDEEPLTVERETDEHGKGVIGSLPTVPGIVGLTLASLAISHITGKRRPRTAKVISNSQIGPPSGKTNPAEELR